MGTENAAVRLHGARLRFPGPQPREVVLPDLEIAPGESVAVTGPSGSGKSTLLQMITGDSHKGYGQDLTLFGHKKGSGESVWDLKENIGYYAPAITDRFRGYHTLEHMVISGLHDSIGLYVQPTDAELNLAGHWLKMLGLQHNKATYFRDLSTGEKRLVMLARAMVKHPPLLILDEPTAGLDPEERNRFNMMLSAIGEDIIVILSTHLVEDVRNLCSQMAIIKNGQVVSQGSPRAYLHELSGKLWSKAVTQKELEQVESNHQIIHSRLVERVMNVTVFSDDCPAGFTPTDPSLEHAYFAHLNTAVL